MGHFAKNVNLEYLTSMADEMKNMKDGHNNPNKLSDDGVFKEEKQKMKAYVAGKAAVVENQNQNQNQNPLNDNGQPAQ
jgi:L-rhamnose isomerase